MSIQGMVNEFSRVTGGDNRSYEEWVDLRKKLLLEEVVEFFESLDSRDPLLIAKEGADVAYVVAGTFVRYGIDLDAAVAEIHRSNMSKVDSDGSFHEREDGKVLKGHNYRPPDMSVAVSSERVA